MSSITRKFFTASLIYFLLGLLSQAVTIFDVWLGFNPLAYTAVSAVAQIFLVGWLSQLALALIYELWLLPAAKKGASLSDFNRANSGMVVFTLFNLGLPLALVGQPGLTIFGWNWLGAVAALGGVCQVLAGLFFIREALILFRGASGV
jgi:hypothetical protein